MNNIFHYFIRYGIGLFLCFSFSLHAQEIIDSVQYRAVYNFSYKTDLEQTDFAKTDLMYLDIGQKATKFYSRYTQIRDSLKEEGLKAGLSAWEINESRKGLKKGNNTAYYQDLSLNKATIVSVFATSGFIYDEKIELPQWVISNEKNDINGYICQKASASFLGRTWNAYFTPEIPFNKGPWKLWGLPGLIVQAYDEENIFEFNLTGFELIKNQTPIIYTHTRSNGSEYKKASKKTVFEYEKRFYDDWFSFSEFITGNKFMRGGGEPIPRVSIDYIPLEPW